MKSDKPSILKFDEANHDHTSVGQGGLLPPLASSLQGKVWASPATTTGTPSFRVLAASDIPALDWAKITTGKPTTLAGYGIADTPWTGMGYLTSQISHADVVQDGDFTSQGILLRGANSGSYSILANNSTNWNTAYANTHVHANLSALNAVSGTNTGDNSPNSLYSGLVSFPGFGTSHTLAAYGDHAHSGVYQPVGSYLTSFTETDPIFSAWNKSTGISILKSQVSNFPTSLSLFANDLGNYGGWITGITKSMVEVALTGNITTHTHSAYLTAITKAQVEAVLTGDISSHSHSQYITGTPWTTMGYVTGTPWTGYGYLTGITKAQVEAVLTGVISTHSHSGGSMTYPGAGIPISNGSAWVTSITNNSANWNTAYTDRNKWDGGSTGLTAATGRTSLGLYAEWTGTLASYNAIGSKDANTIYFIQQ